MPGQAPGSSKLLKFIKFVQLVRSEHPDLFIIDSVGMMCISAFILSVLFRIPFTVRIRADIWTVYEEQKTYLTFPERIYRYILIRICEAIFRRSRRVFPLSHNLAEILEKKGVPKERIRVLHFPIDYKRFRPLKKVKNDYIRLSSVTNLSFKGKFEALISILPEIDEFLTEHKNTSFTIAGDGIFSHVLREEIRRMTNADRVSYVGYQEKIEDLFAESDIFLHFSWLDSFAAVVLEAMSSGLPVVANRYDTMVKWVEHGVTGFIIDDSFSLKDALGILIEDGEMRVNMGKKGRIYVQQMFNIDTISKNYAKEIEEILRDSG